MRQIDKKYYIIGAVLLIVVILGVWFLTRQQANNQTAQTDEVSVFEEPAEEIPMLDDSVEITIKGRTDAVISVANIPEGTSTIVYELSYDTKSGSIEGVRGTIDVTGDVASEDIKFGTCSSGVCRYHEIAGAVNATFIFEGDYGEMMREQEFEL